MTTPPLTGSQGPCTGLRVLEISTMMAGPYAGTLLGDLGADVIKVESHYGDESRHLGPKRGTERSAYLSLNRSKRGIVLDLRRDDAQQVFSKLVATSDIVITNIREPALSKLRLDYDSVKAHREDIIWVGITAFGKDGPYQGRPGIDFLIQGYAGLLALNGEPDGEPVRVTIPLIDTLTSVLAAMGALAPHVRVNAIGPGPTLQGARQSAKHFADQRAATILNRGAHPRDITGALGYFLDSPGITGQLLCVDGGQHLGWQKPDVLGVE